LIILLNSPCLKDTVVSHRSRCLAKFEMPNFSISGVVRISLFRRITMLEKIGRSMAISLFLVICTNAKDTMIVAQSKTDLSIVAHRYYGSGYFDTLLKNYNNKRSSTVRVGDTLYLPEIDSILSRCGFIVFFSKAVGMLRTAGTYQTPAFPLIRPSSEKIDSIAERGRKGADLIEQAIANIKTCCDSLRYPYPKSMLRQLSSAAEEMGSYGYSLRSGNLLASKEIYSGHLHFNLAFMYAALWCRNGYK
jgi:hypothetical protein